jgi:putative peptide zinc metalloprotease protein
MVATVAPGFVDRVVAVDGQMMKQGDPIVVLRDEQLDAEIAQLRAQLAGEELKRAQARVVDPNREESHVVAIRAIETRLNDAERRYNALTLRAPIDGRLVSPHLRDLPGSYLQRGMEIAQVLTPERLVIKTMVDQSDAQLKAMPNKPDVHVRFVGALADEPLVTREAVLIPAAQKELPHQSLTVHGGGTVMTRPDDPKKPEVDQFIIRVAVDNPEAKYLPGQRAYVRFRLDRKRPLVWQGWRRMWQLIETKSKSKWN